MRKSRPRGVIIGLRWGPWPGWRKFRASQDVHASASHFSYKWCAQKAKLVARRAALVALTWPACGTPALVAKLSGVSEGGRALDTGHLYHTKLNTSVPTWFTDIVWSQRPLVRGRLQNLTSPSSASVQGFYGTSIYHCFRLRIQATIVPTSKNMPTGANARCLEGGFRFCI